MESLGFAILAGIAFLILVGFVVALFSNGGLPADTFTGVVVLLVVIVLIVSVGMSVYLYFNPSVPQETAWLFISSWL